MSESDITEVVASFREAKANWVLVGAHAVGLHTEPRATLDFDFIVEASKLRDVLARLEARFGELHPQDIGAGIRLPSLDVDLIRSDNHPLFRAVMEQAAVDEDWRVATPESLVALKYLSATNPWRDRSKRGQDVVDIQRIVRAVAVERTRVVELAGLLHVGAAAELAELLDKIDRGDPIEV